MRLIVVDAEEPQLAFDLPSRIASDNFPSTTNRFFDPDEATILCVTADVTPTATPPATTK